MISNGQLQAILDDLGVTQDEAATLLRVDGRTVRRWFYSGVPGPAERALLSWQRLKRAGISWRPDCIAIGDMAPDLLDIDAILDTVAERGAATPWLVDTAKQRATLGPIIVTYSPDKECFCPVSYGRADAQPNIKRDRFMLEDAIHSIAAALNYKPGPKIKKGRMAR